jgi:hypothetical protein
MLRPDAGLFQIPATELLREKGDTMKGIPKSPRSARLQHSQQQQERRVAAERAAEKRLLVDTRSKMKSIEGARVQQAQNRLHPPSQAQTASVPEAPARQAESVADGARAFLQRPGGVPSVSSAAARGVEAKLARMREDVQSGALRLPQQQQQPARDGRPNPPGSPRRSRSSQSPRKEAGGDGGAASPTKKKPMAAKWGKLRTVGKIMGSLSLGQKKRDRAHQAAPGGTPTHTHTTEGEEEEAPLDRPYVLRSGAFAYTYMQRLHARFLSKRVTWPYEQGGPAVLAQIVRLQRWVRHKRLQARFWGMLRGRRVVVKALTRYVLRFQYRRRHKSAEVVLDFFQTCFQVRVCVCVLCPLSSVFVFHVSLSLPHCPLLRIHYYFYYYYCTRRRPASAWL